MEANKVGANDLPVWELGVSPAHYLARFPNGPNAELARAYVNGDQHPPDDGGVPLSPLPPLVEPQDLEELSVPALDREEWDAEFEHQTGIAVEPPPPAPPEPKPMIQLSAPPADFRPAPHDMRTKVAVVGMAPSSRMDAPYQHRDQWLIFGLNTLWREINDQWDWWIEMHSLDWLRERPAIVQQEYIEWLQSDHGHRPIYMLHPDPSVPNAVQFPMDMVQQRFGTYFRSTIDYMMVMAIMQLQPLAAQGMPCEIAVLGVDMALTEEYQAQRPSVEYYIGMATGLGIKVTIPYKADILKVRKQYGLSTHDPFPQKLQVRRQELQGRLQQAAEMEKRGRDEKMMLRGALDDLLWVDTNWL